MRHINKEPENSLSSGIKTDYFVLVIILVGTIIRFIGIDMPLLEGASTRQVYNAMVTRYFYEHGLNFFYPFMEIRGNALYVQTLDAPVIPYVGALLYRIFGGTNTEILRIISVAFTALAGAILYRLVAYISEKKTALAALFIFIFSPVSIFTGKSALHEMPLIFFTVGSLYYFLRWAKEGRFVFSVLANIFFILAVLIKKTNFYLILPIAYIMFSQWRWKSFRKCYLLAFSILVVLAWQVWEFILRVKFPDPQWIHFDLRYNLERIIFTYTAQEFYKKIYLDIVNYVFTPVGFVFFLIGILLRLKRGSERFLYAWLGAVALFYMIMPEQFWAHGYYHIHYLPIAAFFAARGFIFVLNIISSTEAALFKDKRITAAIFAVIFIIMSTGYSYSSYCIPDSKRAVLFVSAKVGELTGKDDLVIASEDNPTAVLYYSHRKGWPVNFSKSKEEAVKVFEDLRDKGAEYLVSASKTALKSNVFFWDYLRANYKVLFEDDYGIIVEIKNKKGEKRS